MRIFFGIFSVAILAALTFLGVRLKEAHDESEYWKTREATLRHELQELRKEVEEHGAFLDRIFEIVEIRLEQKSHQRRNDPSGK